MTRKSYYCLMAHNLTPERWTEALKGTNMDIQDELKRERILEAIHDACYEHKMHTDYEFAIEQIEANKDFSLDNAVAIIKAISKELNDYGWTTSPKELLDIA